ncbi:SDR family oxidoreductase [Streptomyces sp. NPDC051907]|uniref:NAD-dependent epimerase/dehydratase family protein n=1 Tax=Streptomyces sp. NPDC051907 TaxID=3155284 RepID=UPI0034412FE6
MRILLTGALGYIGQVVGPSLQHAGHEVTSLDIGLFQDRAAGGDRPEGHLFLDVRDVTVTDLIGFDCVVHLAGLSNDACANLQPEAAHSVNEMAAGRLAATAKQAGVRSFVFASSCSVYGRADQARAEHDEPSPLSRYAQTKLGAEQRILAHHGGGFQPVVLRLGTVYGPSPSLRTDLVVNRMAACGVFDRKVVVHGDGLQRRPMVHVREIATAIEGVLAALPQAAGEIFNVAGEHGAVQMKDIAAHMTDLLDVPVVSEAVMTDARDYIVDSRKLRALGIRLDEDFGAAVAATVQHIGSRFASLDEALGAPQNRAAAVMTLVGEGAVDAGLRWHAEKQYRTMRETAR